MAVLPPIPQTPLVSTALDPETGRERLTPHVASDWYQWLLAVYSRLNRSSERLQSKRLPNLNASIAPVALALGSLHAGQYRVTWRFRKTQAATTSSSLLFTLGWTDGGVSMTRSSTAKTGNTTATEDNDTWVIRIDPASPVTYATTYASVGATPMLYELEVHVEQLP